MRERWRMARYAGVAVGLAMAIWSAGYAPAQPPGPPPDAGRGPQPGLGFGGRGGVFGFGGAPGMGMGSNLLNLLRRQDVRKELELLDDQVQQLTNLETKMRDRMREMFARPRDRGQGPPPGDQGARGGDRGPMPDFRAMAEQFNQRNQQLNQEVRTELSNILLPHQMKRLDQLALQMQMQMQMRMRPGSELLGGEVAQKLGVTEQQRGQLQAKVEEVERETRKKIAEVRREAQQKVVALLTPEQQAKFRELVGEPFEFEVEAPPPGGRGFGGEPFGGQPPRKN